MPSREDALREILSNEGSVSKGQLPRLTERDLQYSPYYEDAQNAYEALGGVQKGFPVNPRATWDIEFEGIAVELDEQLHFNRYRAITLSSKAYEGLSSFPLHAYTAYCSNHEQDCLRAGKHGKKWTNASCERQFGVSPNRGALVEPGPARWRQRAFYDFLKDLAPRVLGFPVVRIAIWDTFEIEGVTRTVDWLLLNPRGESAQLIMTLVQKRLPRQEAPFHASS